MYSDFRTKLLSLSDEKYRVFCMRGIPSDRPFLGVRIPDIRKLVEKIPPSDFAEFLNTEPLAIEEVLARGFLIARLPYAEMLGYFDSQIGLLDNWCTVDTFCASLRKVIRHHEADFFDQKVEKLLDSKNEFAIRAGLVSLLDFYVNPDYLAVIFDRVERLKDRDEYYVKMALAWLLAECFIKFEDETYAYLKVAKLPKWTLNKAISKICDSYRVDDSAKAEVGKLRVKTLDQIKKL